MKNQSAVVDDVVGGRLSKCKAQPFARLLVVAGGLATFVLASGSFAQPLETIAIGGQSLYVGMSREEALTRLRVCCQLIGTGDSFFVHSKGAELLGAVWFSDGRVSRVRLEHAHSADSGTSALALALFRTMSDRAPSGSSPAIVETATTQMANGTDRIITIRFPNGRSVTVSVGGPDGFPSAVRVSEDLFGR